MDAEIASVAAAAAGLSAPRLGRRPLSTVFNRYPGDASHGPLVESILDVHVLAHHRPESSR